ncbi:protein kinase [Erythrobacter sp.]|uniref:protein kinase domain-containing protein n=1 Tax=Erythrobacter sp. TaxID=1042 RepID=UPI00311DEDCC
MTARQIDRYRLLQPIGSGGQGEVFLALDTILERRVALKFLAADEFGKAQADRTIGEARHLARLQHPNIVSLFGIAELDGRPALVMEYVEGETLAQRLARGPLAIGEACAIACQLARALDHAASHGLVHGDVSPRNIMIDREGSAKLLDFGVAQLRAAPAELATLTSGRDALSAFSGTLPYTAPERFAGDPADTCGDIYSLGAVTYEMIAGRPAFGRGDPAATIGRVLHGEPPALGSCRPETPHWLEQLVGQMMEKDPARRPGDPGSIAAALQAEGAQPPASGNVPPGIAAPMLRRGKPLAALVLLVGLALVPLPPSHLDRPQGRALWQGDTAESGFEAIGHFYRQGASEHAVSVFSSLLADRPQDAMLSAGLALALMRSYTSRETDPAVLRRAAALARQALAASPYLALSSIAAGWAAEFEGDFAQAERHYATAAALAPDHALLLEGRIRIARKRDDFAGAEQLARHAMAVHPANPVFHGYLGDLLSRQGRQEEAGRVFRAALSLDADNVAAYAGLAHVEHMQGRTGAALRTIQAGLAVHPDPSLYSNLGTYLYFEGRYELAADAFARAIDLSGNAHNFIYWANLADAWQQVPARRAQAVSAYRRAIQIVAGQLEARPGDQGLNSRLALYAAKAGDAALARRALAAASARPEVELSTIYRAVVVNELTGNRQQALVELEKAIGRGYPLEEIKGDPDLDSLRQDIRYHLLIAELGG